MKPTDFLPEKHSIGQAAIDMHVDHEIQMAREECYHAATNAMELHRMLKHISEQEGLQAWASEKITLANDYLRTVKEWLEYEIASKLQQGVAENNPMPPVATTAPTVVASPIEPEILENSERSEGPSMQATHRARLERERGSERELGRDPAPTGRFYLLINGSAYKKNGEIVYFNSSAEATRIGGKINEFRRSKGWRPARMQPIEAKMEEMSAGATGTGAIALGALGGSKILKRSA